MDLFTTRTGIDVAHEPDPVMTVTRGPRTGSGRPMRPVRHERPDISGVARRVPRDPSVAREVLGLANLPTIVAIGRFEDFTHAQLLSAAFTVLQRGGRTQLVLLGTGAQRAAVRRAGPGSAGTRGALVA